MPRDAPRAMSSSIHRPFREHHTLELLREYEAQSKPLDYFISCYFREHKSLGPKDRGCIAEQIYKMIRWKGLYDYLLGKNPSWEERLELSSKKRPEDHLRDETIPLHIRLSFPKELFEKFVDSHGNEKAIELCLACNEPAPTVIRVNTLKIDREKLFQIFKEKKFDISISKDSKTGITFHKKINFFSLTEFQDGFFEVQDEASQLVSQLIPVKKGDQVLDFCAGAGGKTLALAEKLEGAGQIFLHDIRQYALFEARKRLRRAGIQNAQIIHSSEEAKLRKLKKQMDVVLVDAPCSGTGTLRRNPDMKWKFSVEMLQRLESEQRVIFEQALSFVKPDGYIVYATCSVLKEENQDQVAHFLKTYPIQIEGPIFQTIPKKNEKDGFFAVCFRKVKAV